MAVKRIPIIMLTIALLLCGCSSQRDKYTYQFGNPNDQILSIEILRKTKDTASIDDPTEVLYVVPEKEHTEFVKALESLPGEYHALDPLTGLGPYIVRITYQDNQIVLIGYANTVYEQPGGNRRYYYFSFDYDLFHNLIAQVLDMDISKYLVG